MRHSSLTLFAALLLALSTRGWSVFAVAFRAPVDRLIASGEQYLREHPKEAEAHFKLARVHYLAFSIGQAELLTHGDTSVADPVEYHSEIPRGEPIPKRDSISAKRRAEHAARAYDSFKEAIRLAPDETTIALGFACFLRAVFEQKANVPDLPNELKEIDIPSIRERFSRVMKRAVVNEVHFDIPQVRERTIPFEAAGNLIGISTLAPLSQSETQDLRHANEILRRVKNAPRGPITPIVFSLTPSARLAAHLEPNVTVDFDLRGYGFRERWPWVKPDLGFLVWDPENTGQITSSRQLFGSYTFEIFWKDGYEALRSLDDDGSGMLTGDELKGLSVWFDRNSDGKSCREEVIPLHELSVSSIATEATANEGVHPTNPRGITFSDGRALPTWDWIAEPRALQQ